MPFLPSFKAKANNGNGRNLGFLTPYGYTKGQPYQTSWPIQRAMDIGMRQSVWVFRAVDAIASNAAGLPFVLRKDHPDSGQNVGDHPLLPLMNQYPNTFENSWAFRYRLSAQVLLSRTGAFIQLIRSRRGDIVGMNLLTPGTVFPIPDPDTYVSGYLIQAGSERITVDPDQILWIKLPSAENIYEGMTPLEAAGLAVESDILAKQFNRNFLQNDGRPGGILAIKGGMEDEDAEALRNKFLGAAAAGNGPQGAGRLTLIDTGDGGVDFVDTATTPRDAQWTDMRNFGKSEILVAFGVPESVIGNASGKSFDNAGVEQEVFWRSTMLPHLNLLSRALDQVAEESIFAGFDTSAIYILDRDKRQQYAFYLEELKSGAISVNTYLEKTGQEPIGDDHRYISYTLTQYDNEGNTSAVPVGQPAGGRTGGPAGLPEGSDVAQTDNGEDVGHIQRVPVGQHREIPKLPDPLAIASAEQQTFDLKKMAWEHHISKQMEVFFRRQQRVVMEKMTARKAREKWGIKQLTADDFFDRPRWNEQLADDSKDWLELCARDFGVGLPYGIHAAVLAENDRTAEFLENFVQTARDSGVTLDSLVENARQVFAGAISSRARKVAESVVAAITASYRVIPLPSKDGAVLPA